MCFYFKASQKVLKALEKKYQGIEDVVRNIRTRNESEDWIYNGFSHPDCLVVANNLPDQVQLMNWGLLPSWTKDRSIQNNTLNARIETLSEKASFKNCLNNRCLIYADGFYEWQWLDSKGKNKQKYLLAIPNNEPFAFAGLWNTWTDRNTGEILNTFTIITTEANKLMSEIHNSKKRMPVIVGNTDQWLSGGDLVMQNDNLIADLVSPPPMGMLF